ncbi:hypothetical protein GCM10025795_37250 [Verticiella sediminum]
MPTCKGVAAARAVEADKGERYRSRGARVSRAGFVAFPRTGCNRPTQMRTPVVVRPRAFPGDGAGVCRPVMTISY